MTKISVITVSLNAVDCIEEAILSVVNQTYKNIEFILIDGESTDGTLDVINNYHDDINYLVSESDSGLYQAMNKGVQAATGDFIYFLNSDDFFFDENVISDVVQVIEKNQSVELVYGDVLLKKEKQLVRQQQVPVLTRKTLCRYGFCHQALFAKRETLLRLGGFIETYRIVADGDLLARALADGATSLHVDRDIATISLDGLSNTTNWREEKRQQLQSNYTRWELFLWRKLPGIIGRK